MDRRGERRRRKSWADTDKSCEAHLQESSTLAASGSRTELELERGLRREKAAGETVRIGAGDTETCCKMQSEGTAPGLKMSATLAVWQSVSLSDCLPQAGVAPN